MTSIPGDHQENEIYVNFLRTVFWKKARMCNVCSPSKKVLRPALYSFKFLMLIMNISRHLLLKLHKQCFINRSISLGRKKKLSAQ